MKNFIGNYYVEVKHKRYSIHSNERNELRLGEKTKSLGTQYQFQNDTQIRENHKVFKIKMLKLSLRINLKTNNHLFNNLKINYLIVLVAKEKKWTCFYQGYKCQTPEYVFVINKQKHQFNEKVVR